MSDQFQALIRNILMIAGGYFTAKGVVSQDTLSAVMPGLVSLVGVVWSWLHIGKISPAVK